MNLCTRIGAALWSWEPWLALDPTARCAWLALYTTGEAKRLVPGLWHGGPQVLSEAARLSFPDTQAALEEMVQKKMIEWDRRSRVIRLTMLPDMAERATNGNVIRSWWRRFHTVPECGVRNRHIDLLKWLVGPMSGDHAKAWDETFGTLSSLPLGRSRPTEQRMVTNQGDLFDSEDIGNPLRNPFGNQWVIGSGSGSGSDLRAGSGPDLSTADLDPSTTVDTPVLDLVPLIAAQRAAELETPIGAAGAPVSPRTAEAPPVAPLAPQALHEALVRCGGKRYLPTLDPTLDRGLTAACGAAVAAGFGVAEVEHLGRWYAAGGEAWRGDLGASFFARGGNLVEAIEKSRRWSVGSPIVGAARASPHAATPPSSPRPERFIPEPVNTAEQRAELLGELGVAHKLLGIVKP